MELLLSILFGVLFVGSGVFYGIMTKDTKKQDRDKS